MDKHAQNRAYYEAQAERKKRDAQHKEMIAKLEAQQKAILKSFNSLITYIHNATISTKLENPTTEVSTPDVQKVVDSVDKLTKFMEENKLDLTPLESAIKKVEAQIGELPKDKIELPEAREDIKVTNLSDIDFKPLIKAVSELKLVAEAPKVDVKAPIVNVDAPDLSEIKSGLGDVVKAIGEIETPEIPETDLTTVEKELKKQTTHLKDLLEQMVHSAGGGGGGGGHGTPYVDDDGAHVYPTLIEGAVPIVTKPTDLYSWQATSADSTYKYFFFEDRSANWYIMRKHKTNKVADYWKGTGGYVSVYQSPTQGPGGTPSWAGYGATF